MTAEPSSEPVNVTEFLSTLRQRRSAAEQQKSKLEPYHEAIFAAISEKFPIKAIHELLQENYTLTVSYSNLRDWIRKQPESHVKTRRKRSKAHVTAPATPTPGDTTPPTVPFP
jgi:transposase